MAAIPVADLHDPRLALYRGVRDPDLLRAHGVFVAEGRLVVERLLAQARFRARSVLVTSSARASLAHALERAACPVYIVELSLMEGLTGFNIHRGCLAIGERGQPRTLDEIATTTGPLVCLESVGNPDNVGGVFRSAAAFGAAGVVLSPGCSDPLYRKAVRTSMGASLSVPFAESSDWPGAITTLREKGWTVMALTPADDAQDIRTSAAASADRVALLLGHEGTGLTHAAQQLASARIRIPTTSAVDSLNVATAAAIGLYAITAGRSQPPAAAYPR